MSDFDITDDKFKKLRAFTMHGVNLNSLSGSQVQGDCPFCGKEKKFFVNPENMAWDCKVCGEAGGFLNFLDKVNERNKKQLTPELVKNLAEDRKLPIDAFNWPELGFNNGQYTLAIRNGNKKIADLKMYKPGGKWISTSGAKVNLFGAKEMIEAKVQQVYLCEGESDTLAMNWLLKASKKPGVAVGVPGANTFKPEWADLFQGKDVTIVYDHDAPGIKGEQMVLERLIKKVRSLKFCHWPSGSTVGYDARDFIIRRGVAKNTPRKCFRLLNLLFKDSPRADTDKETTEMLGELKPPDIDPSVTIHDVLRAYETLLHQPNHMSIEIALIIMLSKLFDTNPIWMFLVAPPSSGKTQVISGLKYLCQPYDDTAYSLSALTTHALISGMETKRGDPSVFARIDGKRTSLVIKDFTTVLSMPESEKMEITGQFRDSFDGYTSKSFGNGITREYNKLKFGVLAAVTPEIYNESVTFQALGERFAKLNIGRTNDIEFSEAAITKALSDDSKSTFKADEDTCAKLMYSCFKNIQKKVEDGTVKLPKLNAELKEAIMGLSLFVASMRGVVGRDKFRRDYIKAAPYSESGIRYAKMISDIASYRALLYGKDEATIEDLPIVKKISLDTISQRDEEILRRVYKLNMENSTQEPLKHLIQQGSKYTAYTCHCVLEDLRMLDMLSYEKVGRKYYYRISPKCRSILGKAKIYETAEDLARDNDKVILKRAPTGLGDPRRKLVIKRRP